MLSVLLLMLLLSFGRLCLLVSSSEYSWYFVGHPRVLYLTAQVTSKLHYASWCSLQTTLSGVETSVKYLFNISSWLLFLKFFARHLGSNPTLVVLGCLALVLISNWSVFKVVLLHEIPELLVPLSCLNAPYLVLIPKILEDTLDVAMVHSEFIQV